MKLQNKGRQDIAELVVPKSRPTTQRLLRSLRSELITVLKKISFTRRASWKMPFQYIRQERHDSEALLARTVTYFLRKLAAWAKDSWGVMAPAPAVLRFK